MNNKLDASNNQCPHCGARELFFDKNINKYKCSYCNSTFDENKELIIEKDISKLDKEKISQGVHQLNPLITDIIALKCPGCGAEIIINTKESKQARCHWCHGILNLTNKIANGSIPDAILPFSVSKEEAVKLIKKYLNRKRIFTSHKFKKEFNEENLEGVYFPYIIIDINAHCEFIGKGEQFTYDGKYTGRRYEDVQNANLFQLTRKFDLQVDDLTFESLQYNTDERTEITNNIINAIQPFDTENCIKFAPHYLLGYHSENRNIDLVNIRDDIDKVLTKIARHTIGKSIIPYSYRGFVWDKEIINQKGSQTIAAYLPIWLYTYHEKNKDKEIIHYIAINGRTKEIKGSVPIDKIKLFLTSLLFAIPGIALFINYLTDKSHVYLDNLILNDEEYKWQLIFKSIFALLLAIVPFLVFYNLIKKKYRNKDLKHTKHIETKHTISNYEQEDKFLELREGLRNKHISGFNPDSLEDYLDKK